MNKLVSTLTLFWVGCGFVLQAQDLAITKTKAESVSFAKESNPGSATNSHANWLSTDSKEVLLSLMNNLLLMKKEAIELKRFTPQTAQLLDQLNKDTEYLIRDFGINHPKFQYSSMSENQKNDLTHRADAIQSLYTKLFYQIYPQPNINEATPHH